MAVSLSIRRAFIEFIFCSLPFTYSKTGVRFRRKISPYLTKAFAETLPHEISIHKNEYENDGKQTIYSATHVFYDDIAAVCGAINENIYLISDDDTRRCITPLTAFALYLNGVIFFEKSKDQEKKLAAQRMVEVLNNGGNILIFPESTWNFRSNMPIREELPWGLLNAADATNANVVPVAVDLVGNRYVISIGKKLERTNDKKTDITRLRDEMATLVWEIYEMKEPLKRLEVGCDEIYWYNYIQEKCQGDEYDFVKEENCAFKPEGKVSLDEVIADLFGMEYRSIASDYETYKKIRKLSDGFARII